MNNKQGNLKTFICKIKNENFNSENFKIYSVTVDEEIYKDIKHNKRGGVTIVGNIPNLIPNLEYKVEAYIDVNSKFGYQYSVKTIRQDKPTDYESSFSFLKEITSEDKAKVLLNAYPNIIDKIIKNDLADLDFSKTKGIKEKTFEGIKQKVLDNFELIDLIDTYKGYIPMNIMKKLKEKYTNAKIVKAHLNKEPYKCLCGLSRVGFKSADKILLELDKASKENPNEYDFSFAEELLTSKQRMKACINYLLAQNELEGNTRISIQELRKESNKLTPECIDKFVEIIKENNNDIYVNNDLKCISTMKAYKTELYIITKLKELNNTKIIWNCDVEQYRETKEGTATDEQMEVLSIMCENNVACLTAPAGCVDKDTEFFDGIKWKNISEYNKGDKVLQFNPKTKVAELVCPQRYIKEPCNTLWHFKTKYGLDQCLSDEHDVIYETDKHNLKVRPFKEIKKMHEKSKGGFEGKFLTTFNYSGTGIDLSEFEIRLMCAVICDGSFKHTLGQDVCRINIKKQRKKDRLEWILNNLKIPYKKVQWNPKDLEFNTYLFKSPRIEKEFTSYWYNCNNEQFKIICDEIIEWDGCKSNGRMTFSTVNKNTADFVQFAYATQGKKTIINVRDRIGQVYKNEPQYTRKSLEYELTISDRNKVSMGGFHKDNPNKTKIEEYKTLDGYKYCFTVPSEALVLRRNNKIFITGNCGKSFSMKNLLNMCDDLHKTYMLCSPTGKASEVLSEQTGRDAGTIHRKLEYKPIGDNENPWGYNEDNKLKVDLVVVDEFSMVDIYLFKHLLEAIDTSKTKLLLVFDSYQLPSVGCGNIAQDLLDIKLCPIVRLTKIFRYAEGGLMQVVTKIRNSEQFLPSDFTGVKIFGTKKDFVFVELQQQKIISQVLKIYDKLLKDGYDSQDITVLASQNKGDYGVDNINNYIQKLIQKGKNHHFLMNGNKKFFEGDKVVQIVNNYKAKSYDGDEEEVFNGNTGIVVSVDFDSMVVDFGNNKLIVYEKMDLDQIQLGYCTTIHKCVPEDTLIYTNKGIKPLSYLNNGAKVGEMKRIEDNIYVYNGECFEKPLNFYNDGESICNNITTKIGYNIVATDNHGLDVLDKNGKIKRKNAKDIIEGDYLILEKGTNIYGDNIKIPKSLIMNEKDFDIRAKIYKTPKIIDKDFCTFLGMMVADGVIAQRGISYGKNQKEVVEEFSKIVYRLFGYKCKIKHIKGIAGGMYKIEIGSVFIRDYCKKILGIQPNDKFTPPLILSTTKENQCAYLKGRFEDGSIHLKNGKFDLIEMAVYSLNEIKEIRTMLLNMGIISSYKRYKNKNSSKGYNDRISIYKEYAYIFKDLIGFFSYDKQEKLNLLNKDEFKLKGSNYIIPNLSNIINNIIIKNNIVMYNINPTLSRSISINKISRYMLKLFIDYCENNNIKDDNLKYLKTFLNGNIYIDKVCNITKEIKHCYCLEMPKTHKFLQNGFKGWNCQGISVKQVICVVPKAHNFMINSNLLYVAGTRARERVYMIGNILTVNRKLKEKANFNRNTWLKDL